MRTFASSPPPSTLFFSFSPSLLCQDGLHFFAVERGMHCESQREREGGVISIFLRKRGREGGKQKEEAQRGPKLTKYGGERGEDLP